MRKYQPRRILIVGSGAIGGYVGGRLAAAGHTVVLLCTPATAAAIRTDGLRLVAPEGDLRVHPEVVTSPAEAFVGGPIDLAIVAVKRYDTVAVAGPLAGFAGEMDSVLCLQNGIGAEEDLAALLGSVRILPGTVTTAVSRMQRNTVVVERKRGIGIAGTDEAAGRWVEAFDDAGLACRQYPVAADMKWSKLITNVIANPISAILDLPPAAIFADKDLFRLEIEAVREVLAVMKAVGARVVDLPGKPVRALAFCSDLLPL
jgi:2-dehydropantoate 2-reductase